MADPNAPQVPDDEKPSLLTVLEDLGDTLVQSELPSPSKMQHILGAVVKVMDHAGVEVADELYPAEPEPVSRPETAQAQHAAKTNTRLDRLENALERVLGHLEGQAASQPAPDAGAGPAKPGPSASEAPADDSPESSS